MGTIKGKQQKANEMFNNYPCHVDRDLNQYLNEQEEQEQAMNNKVDEVMAGDTEEDSELCLTAFYEDSSAASLITAISTVDIRGLPFSAISDAQVKQLARAAYRINKLIEAELPDYLDGEL